MVEEYFQLNSKQTTIRTEVVAGVTTFLTMAYIIFVNPAILSAAGMDKQALVVVTCIASAITTATMGLIGNAPIAMAPGMGLNAFLAYSLVKAGQITWETALGVVFLSGLSGFILTLLGLRKRLVEAIPVSLIAAIAVGIGLFITFIGLVNMGVVVKNEETLVSAGPMTPTVTIGLAGLLMMAFLEIRKVKGALLMGIAFSTLLAVVLGYVEKPVSLVSFNFDIRPVAFRLDILGAFKWGLFGSVFTLMFMDMFDGIGTLVACCHEAGMVDERGRIKGLGRLLAVDTAASMVGAVFGTSNVTAYIESAAGIEQGGRTGLTALVTALCFVLALLFVPLVGVVPSYATAPALVMVGLFMMKEIKRIDFTNMEEAMPSFIILVMIALSYSISTGLAFGFISFVLIKLVAGRVRDVKPTMWVIALLSLMFVTMDHLRTVLNLLK
jgi:AGZA family xanthine/uracil permease-like MFS transporter